MAMIGPSGRIGIKDVARAAGVSVTTVSHALNGKGRLPEATRLKVRSVAEELGYRPNASARNLVSGTSGIMGIAVSTAPQIPFGLSDFDYFIQLLSSATTTALEMGRALVVTGPVTGTGSLANVQLDGAIIVDPITDDPLVSEMTRRDIPFVTTGRMLEAPAGAGLHWVDNDHAAGTVAMLEHLADRGADRVALITGPPVTSYTVDAIEGYEAWCDRSGREPLVATAEGSLNEGSGFVAAETLLDLREPPDAIYATLDRLALGVLIAARSRGLEVPGDLLVAGCTDSQAGAWAEPALTALALHPEKIGRSAVHMLIDLIEGGAPDPGRHLVETSILVRESTASGDRVVPEPRPARSA